VCDVNDVHTVNKHKQFNLHDFIPIARVTCSIYAWQLGNMDYTIQYNDFNVRSKADK